MPNACTKPDCLQAAAMPHGAPPHDAHCWTCGDPVVLCTWDQCPGRKFHHLSMHHDDHAAMARMPEGAAAATKGHAK